MAQPAQKKKKSYEGRVSFALLVSLVVLASIAGGSSNVWMLPLLSGLAGLAYISSVLACYRKGRRLPVSYLSLVLLALSAFTLLQAFPLSGGLLEILSPKAYELRSFANSQLPQAAISYEPGLSAREAAKLLVYFLVTIVAYERARARQTGYRFIIMIMGAVMASILVGGVHRIAHLDKMLGFIPSMVPAHQLLTTFVNPNHAAGFTAWGCIMALGLALDQPRRHLRLGFGALALVCAMVCVMCASRGGYAVLALGLLGFGVIGLTKRGHSSRGPLLTWLGGTALVALVCGFVLRNRIIREFASTDADPFGIAGKLSAIQGAEHILADHPWLGIGRGAYVSLFSHYKTTPYQFTYTHPENMLVQFVCDWGIIVGLTAFFGYWFVILSNAKKASSYAEIGLMVGLIALSIQNLFDFSLELLGVAIPAFVAITSFAAIRRAKLVKVDVSSPMRISFALFLPLFFLFAANYAAFERGVLEHDISKLKEAPHTEIAHRHPANAYVATQMAFHAENANPPQLKEALKWANLALYLAPSYAEANLLAGRLLLKAAYKRQGFEQIRIAWQKTNQHIPTDYFKLISHYAQTANDYLETVPRRDIIQDHPDERELMKLIRWLNLQKNPEVARELTKGFLPLEDVEDPKRLEAMAWSFFYVRDYEAAIAVIDKLDAHPETANSLKQVRLKILAAVGDHEKALLGFDELLKSGGDDRLAILNHAFNLALRTAQNVKAQDYLEQLSAELPPTDRNQFSLIRKRIRLAERRRQPGEVLKLLDQGLALKPSSAELRLKRVQINMKANRLRAAKIDLEMILRTDPQNMAAKQYLSQIQQHGDTSKPGR